MHEFMVKNGGILKDKNTSKKIYFNITTCLLIIMVYGLIRFTILGNLLKGIFLIIIPIITNLLTEYIYYLIKKEKKTFTQLITEDYSYLTGLMLSLLISINTNYLILFIVSIIITIIKLLEGGIFRNLIHPVVLGTIILNLIYPIKIQEFNNFNLGILFNNELNILGNISPILIIILFIYLLFNYSIKKNNAIYSILVITIIYLITILFKINTLPQLLNILFSTNLLFCLTFLASDNIITPLTKKANIFSGLFFGLMYILLLIFDIKNAIYATLITNILNIILKKIEVNYNFNK